MDKIRDNWLLYVLEMLWFICFFEVIMLYSIGNCKMI